MGVAGSRVRGLLVRLVPAGACGCFGDGAASAGAERRGAGRSAFEPAEAAECGGVRIGLVGDGAPVQDFDTFGRGLAARAGRADEVGVFGLDALFEEIADQAATADGEEDGTRASHDA